MKFFALETDLKKLEQRFISDGEQHIITVFYHWILFFFGAVRYALVTLIIVILAVTVSLTTGSPWTWTSLVAFAIWLCVVPFPLLTRYIDWRYDLIFVTTTRVITVNQASIFRQTIQQLNLENFASVTSQTQFANILPFGKLIFELKEGHGQAIIFKYIPDAANVADKISDAVAIFARGPGTVTEEQKRMVKVTPPLTTAKEMDEAVMPS